MNNDIFDSGTPKYSTAQDICDALYQMTSMEEANIFIKRVLTEKTTSKTEMQILPEIVSSLLKSLNGY